MTTIKNVQSQWFCETDCGSIRLGLSGSNNFDSSCTQVEKEAKGVEETHLKEKALENNSGGD